MGTDEKKEIISKIKNLFKESTFWIAIPVVYAIFYFFISSGKYRNTCKNSITITIL